MLRLPALQAYADEIQELEPFEMAKIDVIEERLNNHIKFVWTVIGIVLAVLSFTAVELYRINGHLGELDGLKEKVTKVELQTQASLPQPAFEKALPDIKSALADAHKDRIRVPPAVIEGLRSKLLASSSEAPDFWPTLSELVSYRSALSYRPHAAAAPAAPEVRVYAIAKPLPNCTDSLPKPMTVKEVLSPHEAIPNRGLYENCRFVLDSEAQNQKLNAILKGSIPLLTFKNCLIEYHGGEISLILAWDKEPFTSWERPGRSYEDHSYDIVRASHSI